MCRRSWSLWIVLSAGLVNVMVLLYLTSRSCDVSAVCNDFKTRYRDSADVHARVVNKSITFILREFEDFENDVADTALSLSKTSANSVIIVIADDLPYPPLELTQLENVHLVSLRGLVEKPMSSSRPDTYIRSEYVAIIPDGVRVAGWSSLKRALDFLESQTMANPLVTMAAFPLNNSTADCIQLDIDTKRWTANFDVVHNGDVCDAVGGHPTVLLLKTNTYLDLSYPYLRPFQPAIFIQNSLRGHKVTVNRQKALFYQSVELFKNDMHKKWKHEQKERKRMHEAFSIMGIKLVHYATGQDDWYGCGKETPRCFGTVVNDMPEFIYQNRWTPPCCLQALRITVHHVFKILKEQDVRFWLEGGSLLGAARNGDIIPWDYDVDIGIYSDDIVKSTQLVSCQSEAHEDDEGFVWERATEGEFFRVQYSQSNHLHVDIFPFRSVNGTMTKNTWFKTHRQDREFPEAFLKPFGSIHFVGIEAPVPNNVRKFLEFKFGEGVIDNPKYPNAQSV